MQRTLQAHFASAARRSLDPGGSAATPRPRQAAALKLERVTAARGGC
jgi:hypothetical protein